MNQRILVMIITAMALIAISGCTVNKIKPVPVEPRFDPVWPVSIKPVDIDWAVTVKDNKAYVGTSYQDSLKLRAWMEDTKRYIIDLQSMVCYYRTGMETPDPKCIK